jgi:hypothetical protein
MAPEPQITFGPFRLEGTPGRLWRGDEVIPLRPRSLAILYLLSSVAGSTPPARIRRAPVPTLAMNRKAS